MRLLNVHTLQFRDFYGIPANCIVASHRWSAGNEAMLDDVKNGQRMDTSGYKKVFGFTNFIKINFPHIDWLWIDTCCVKQDSDREVSEAVNSMFRWYSQAEFCLAYLADVDDATDSDQFARSVWFRRGWTLQELLAPQAVLFLSQDWKIIGYKGSDTTRSGFKLDSLGSVLPIISTIAAITNIPQGVLGDYTTSKIYSIDTRLAWMRGRETTREEDMIYSLFGIFDVTLPVIYGETAERAKRRLLKEIAEMAHPLTSGEALNNDSQQVPQEHHLSQVSNAGSSFREGKEHRPNMLTSTSNKDDEFDYNEDDALINDIAEAAFANGGDAFEHKDYYSAESHYREVLELTNKLSVHSKYRNDYDIPLLHLRLAVCAFHTDDPVVAERALSDVIRDSNCRPLDALDICEASHLMTQLSAMTRKLNDAIDFGKATYNWRRNHFGKDSMECYESLALLSTVNRLTGDEREAARYLSVIPKDIQSSLLEKFSGLLPVRLRWSGSKQITNSKRTVQGVSPCLAFSQDSKVLASIKGDAAIGLWDVTSGEEIMQLNAMRNPIRDIVISRDCKQVAAVVDKQVLLWNTNGGGEPAMHKFCEKYCPIRVVFSSDGRVLVVGTYGAHGQYWLAKDLTSSENLMRLERHAACAIPVILPDGKRIVSAAKDGTVSVWHPASETAVMTLGSDSAVTSRIDASIFGKKLALWSVNSNGTSIRLWDISTGRVTQLELNYSSFKCLTPDLSLIIRGVSRGAENILEVRRLKTGYTMPMLECSGTAWESARFSPDHQVLAAIDQDGLVTLWEAASMVIKTPQQRLQALKTMSLAKPVQRPVKAGPDTSTSKSTIGSIFAQLSFRDSSR